GHAWGGGVREGLSREVGAVVQDVVIPHLQERRHRGSKIDVVVPRWQALIKNRQLVVCADSIAGNVMNRVVAAGGPVGRIEPLLGSAGRSGVWVDEIGRILRSPELGVGGSAPEGYRQSRHRCRIELSSQ